MSWFSNAVKSVGNFVADTAKAVSYVAVAPINSVTGHKYNPDYDTKVGKVLGQGAQNGIDNVHTLGKSFADTISAGYASKAVNLIRTDENKESAYNYGEMRAYGDGIFGKVRGGLTSASGSLGAVFGGIVAAKAGINLAQGSQQQGEQSNINQAAVPGQMSDMLVPAIAIILLIVVFSGSKK